MSPSPSRADLLRGEYGPYRANNDLLFYHLDIRVDPERKFISGKNTIRFKMLNDGSRIQLDLLATLNIDRILLGATPLKYERELHTVYVDFPETLKAGRTVSIDFFYSGKPVESGRFGGFAFRKDASGHDWINSTCEGPGAMVWWPNKDQWRDEVEEMRISVAIPNHLVDVSNGKFVGKTDLQDGYTRWDWFVQYPINNYNVSVRPMADHPSVHGLEDTLDFAKEGRIRGRDRPVLRQRRPLKEAARSQNVKPVERCTRPPSPSSECAK